MKASSFLVTNVITKQLGREVYWTTARRKALALKKKYQECIQRQDELKDLTAKGKRGPEDQSPGKVDNQEDANDDDWTKVGSGEKKGRNSKKKVKSQEELDIEKALFSKE